MKYTIVIDNKMLHLREEEIVCLHVMRFLGNREVEILHESQDVMPLFKLLIAYAPEVFDE